MTRLGFEVKIFRNTTKTNAQGLLDLLQRMVLTQIDVFGMAISSHGSADNIIYLTDTHADVNFFVDPIKEWVTGLNLCGEIDLNNSFLGLITFKNQVKSFTSYSQINHWFENRSCSL
jgi:hypothetical protein